MSSRFMKYARALGCRVKVEFEPIPVLLPTAPDSIAPLKN